MKCLKRNQYEWIIVYLQNLFFLHEAHSHQVNHPKPCFRLHFDLSPFLSLTCFFLFNVLLEFEKWFFLCVYVYELIVLFLIVYICERVCWCVCLWWWWWWWCWFTYSFLFLFLFVFCFKSLFSLFSLSSSSSSFFKFLKRWLNKPFFSNMNKSIIFSLIKKSFFHKWILILKKEFWLNWRKNLRKIQI